MRHQTSQTEKVGVRQFQGAEGVNVKPLHTFVAGFVLGVLTPMVLFLAVAVLFPGERRQYRLTSDLVLEDVAEFGEFANENTNASGAKSVIRKGRTLFVNVKKGTVNYISFETTITDDTLETVARAVTEEHEKTTGDSR